MARELAALDDDLLRGVDEGGAGEHQRLGAAGAGALLQRTAIAGDEIDLVEGNTEPILEDLRECRLMALTGRAGADGHDDAPLRREAYVGGLLRLVCRDLQVIRHADAEQLAA